MSVQIVNIDLLGTSFTVQTDESLDYMQSLILRLRERLDALKTATRVSDPLKLSILANITILDELVRERSKDRGGVEALEFGSQEDELSRVTARLIAVIDRSLGQSSP
ncbi:MAG TPA: cell division protein ZapA [Rectinemataceae bacterium]|nr:cell division protein ZapA [Rectinemataceae bacterium]